MSRSFSLYLDFVRFCAALLVFLWHARSGGDDQSLLFSLGHEAVVIFFVLSGFVIAYCRDNKEKSLHEFAINRASRIYSVALPAVIITIVLDLACAYLAPQQYGAFYDLALVRVIGSLTFMNEIWFLSIQSFSNTPYWSINYEVWYYILFAILAYVTRLRTTLFVIASLIVGPKVLLLAPCWWFGVWIYRTTMFDDLSRRACLAVFIASVVAFGFYISLGVAWWSWKALESALSTENFRLFAFSRHFLTDYALAVIIGFNFGAARSLLRQVDGADNQLTRWIRTLAATTFALYLLHQPILHFFGVVLAPLELSKQMHYFCVGAISLIIILIVGFRIERTKTHYRRAFEHAYRAVSTWINRVAPDFLASFTRTLKTETK